MCTGVDSGFAIFRFSTSPSMSGFFEIIVTIIIVTTTIGVRSFVRNIGLNLILSILVFVPVGFDDPLSCSAIRCTTTIAAIAIGKMKCSEKNRFKVGCDTEKFPHIHSTNVFPIMGIAEKMFVITVAPQNDICPHGNTYPRNAAAIVITISMIPDDHTIFLLWGDLKYIPRAV